MTAPKWVTRELVEFIHEAVIELGGGAHGLRDVALLESALARPRNQHSYGEEDIFHLVSDVCYAEAISRNHAFVDGAIEALLNQPDLPSGPYNIGSVVGTA